MQTREMALNAANRLGLIGLWRHVHRGRIPILMFHGVVGETIEADCRPLRFRLSSTAFSEYIETLAKQFQFISLSDAANMLAEKKPIEGHTMVLTFDDAYECNATVVWPILRQYGATATFFLPTGYIDTERLFWADRLDYAIRNLPCEPISLQIGERVYRLMDGDRTGATILYWKLKKACLRLGWKGAGQIVDRIEKLIESRLVDGLGSNPWARLMSWSDVQAMQEEGAEFGSHTVGHHLLGDLDEEELTVELEQSKKQIEIHTGRPCLSLAYPRGEYTLVSAQAVRRAGYRYAVTTDDRLACMEDPPMMLPRIGISRRAMSPADLLARVTGLSQSLSRATSPFAAAGK